MKTKTSKKTAAAKKTAPAPVRLAGGKPSKAERPMSRRIAKMVAETFGGEKKDDGAKEMAESFDAMAKEAREANKPKARAKKPVEMRACLCGCGASVKGSFAPGHDQRVVKRIIALHYGDIAGFVKAHEGKAKKVAS